MQDLEQSIRERAYHLWIADGCRDGRDDTHLCLSEIKHAHTDDEVRQEMA
jgi:hypothetical protein